MSKTFDKVVNLIEKMLSDEGGDSVVKSLTLRKEADNIIEEANELKQELLKDRLDIEHLKEEVGDVLWDIILICKIAEKQKLFTIQEMLELLKEKIQERNPHVFGNEKANSLKEAIEAKRRAKEKWKERKSHL